MAPHSWNWFCLKAFYLVFGAAIKEKTPTTCALCKGNHWISIENRSVSVCVCLCVCVCVWGCVFWVYVCVLLLGLNFRSALKIMLWTLHSFGLLSLFRPPHQPSHSLMAIAIALTLFEWFFGFCGFDSGSGLKRFLHPSFPLADKNNALSPSLSFDIHLSLSMILVHRILSVWAIVAFIDGTADVVLLSRLSHEKRFECPQWIIDPQKNAQKPTRHFGIWNISFHFSFLSGN